MANNFTLDFTKESKRIAKKMQKHLPTAEINKGLSKVMKSELKKVRTAVVKEAGAKEGLTAKFLKKWSGIKFRKGNGVYWQVAKNIRLDRAAATITQRSGGVSGNKRILKRARKADGAFHIGKNVLRREDGKLRAHFINVGKGIKEAFKKHADNLPTSLRKEVFREMKWRLSEWRKKVGAK